MQNPDLLLYYYNSTQTWYYVDEMPNFNQLAEKQGQLQYPRREASEQLHVLGHYMEVKQFGVPFTPYKYSLMAKRTCF